MKKTLAKPNLRKPLPDKQSSYVYQIYPPDTMKKCIGELCKGKEHLLENFNRLQRGRCQRNPRCKECQKIYRRKNEYKEYPKQNDGEKFCKGCMKSHPMTEFNADSRQSDGNQTKCRKWQSENHRKIREVDRFTDLRKYFMTLLKDLKRNAKGRNIVFSGEITASYLVKLYKKQNGICLLTGKPLALDREVTYLSRGRQKGVYQPSCDRIDSSNGYHDGNIQLVCSAVNTIKSDLPMDHLRRLTRIITQYQKTGNHPVLDPLNEDLPIDDITDSEEKIYELPESVKDAFMQDQKLLYWSDETGTIYKKCPRCTIWDESYFWKDSTRADKDGLQGTCKRCLTIYEKKKKYHDLESFIKYIHIHVIQNAKKRNIPVEITALDIEDLYKEQNGMCSISGLSLTYQENTDNIIGRYFNSNISVDRIDNLKPYIWGNIQLVCSTLNRLKWDMPHTIFIELLTDLDAHLNS